MLFMILSVYACMHGSAAPGHGTRKDAFNCKIRPIGTLKHGEAPARCGVLVIMGTFWQKIKMDPESQRRNVSVISDDVCRDCVPEIKLQNGANFSYYRDF
jgi:hypothetical protein